jgi:putative membrane protein
MNSVLPLNLPRLGAALVAALLGLSVAAPVFAADSLKHSDRTFIEKAAKGGQKEVQLSELASSRATNPQIREFAEMLTSDHKEANDELAALAERKGVMLPAADVNVSKWNEKKTSAFDKDYVDEMVDDHDDAISLYEKAAKSEDPDIAAFAQKFLPKIQAHYTQAKSLKKMF